MNVELDRKEQGKDERQKTKDKSESLIEGPQCFVICHCCGAVVFIDEEKIKEQREKDDGQKET